MYQKIINEIKKNLSGNKNLDRNYLISQIEVYKTHEYSTEIIKEISRMIWNCLSDEEKEEYINIMNNETPAHDILTEAEFYIQTQDYNTALNKLDNFMNNYPKMYAEDRINEYHSFSNPIEEILFDKYFKPTKKVRLIPDNEPLVDLYYTYGFLLIKNSRFDEAEENLKEALRINPVCVKVLLELAKVYKTTDLDKFYSYTINAHKYTYSSLELAQIYRNLGYFYIEENNLELAKELYNNSLNYESNTSDIIAIEYIELKGCRNLTENEKINLIKKNKIPMEANPFIIETLKMLSQDFENNNLNNQAVFFYKHLYALTKDKNILNKIRDLKCKRKL